MSRAPRSSRRRRSDWVEVAAPAARRCSTVTPRAPRSSEATRISPAERGPASSVRRAVAFCSGTEWPYSGVTLSLCSIAPARNGAVLVCMHAGRCAGSSGLVGCTCRRNLFGAARRSRGHKKRLSARLVSPLPELQRKYKFTRSADGATRRQAFDISELLMATCRTGRAPFFEVNRRFRSLIRFNCKQKTELALFTFSHRNEHLAPFKMHCGHRLRQ